MCGGRRAFATTRNDGIGEWHWPADVATGASAQNESRDQRAELCQSEAKQDVSSNARDRSRMGYFAWPRSEIGDLRAIVINSEKASRSELPKGSAVRVLVQHLKIFLSPGRVTPSPSRRQRIVAANRWHSEAGCGR